MAMTAAVKDELSRVTITRASARRAEIATMLRFAGALHLVAGHIVIEAELDTGSVARRLRREIAEVFGHSAEIQGTRYYFCSAQCRTSFDKEPARYLASRS